MTKQYPKALLEFEHWFRTEKACRSYLVRVRWPSGFLCPRCGHGQAWEKSRGHFRCGSCRADIAVTAGTIFHGSRLPLRLWFRAMWLLTNQKSGVSALGLQRTLGLGSYETAWTCLHKLRRAMVRPDREQLSGKVEVDETIVGGRTKGKGGLYLGKFKSLVAVAAEARGKETGRIRLKRIPNASAKSLDNFVKSAVTPGAEVITDGSWSYNNLAILGYIPRTVVLSGKGKEASSLVLPRVHRVASLLKRWLMGIHQGRVSKRHLDGYLDEFTFRFNRRRSSHRGMLFYRLVQQAVAIDPTSYSDLVARN